MPTMMKLKVWIAGTSQETVLLVNKSSEGMRAGEMGSGPKMEPQGAFFLANRAEHANKTESSGHREK